MAWVRLAGHRAHLR